MRAVGTPELRSFGAGSLRLQLPQGANHKPWEVLMAFGHGSLRLHLPYGQSRAPTRFARHPLRVYEVLTSPWKLTMGYRTFKCGPEARKFAR